jgi:CIC family chloride channel protein
MIFELTRDYTIIVPLMISNLIAYFISQHYQRQPIYEALARQDGIHLPTAEHQVQRARLRVSTVMRPATDVLSPRMAVESALASTRTSALDAWPVADEDGLCGMVDREELERVRTEGGGTRPLADLLKTRPSPHRPDAAALPHVHVDHGLTLALERMGALRYSVLPVVSRANIRQILGVVTLQDVLEAYGVAGNDRRRGPDG